MIKLDVFGTSSGLLCQALVHFHKQKTETWNLYQTWKEAMSINVLKSIGRELSFFLVLDISDDDLWIKKKTSLFTK